MTSHPAFGQADLTNCERELIHLAGSIQPHGMFLAVEERTFRIVQASANAPALVQLDAQALLGQGVASLGGDLETTLRQLAQNTSLGSPVPLRCTLQANGQLRAFEGTVHRVEGGVLLVEVEPLLAPDRISLEGAQLLSHVDTSVQLFSAASTLGVLADAVVRHFRDLVGYDRVMVYRFDPDGHGKIIAEARDPRLDSLLGHHYPATDIPQRARELYVRTRLRVLVDVHYEAAALVPRRLPGSNDELDMSLCHLRSMSPLHLQYLKNMGVTATLVVSLVREGRLWGLIACHHYSPRNLTFAVRTAAELLAEVISTRIAAIENYAHAQVAIQVRRLEQRLIEATSTEGDWRLALFRNPHTLLKPVEATGAALFFEGEIQTSGEVPSTPELRALLQWVHGQEHDGMFNCSAVARANPSLESLTPTASGVLAVRLSSASPDYLMWFRKEQLLTVTWAGDPTKPVVGNDPLELSPRRSFAAWSEIVRGTALPWTGGEIALAGAFGGSLVDIILQVNAVRLLIAEHQLSQTRAAVANSREPVIIVDAGLRILFANDAFYQLARRPRDTRPTLDAIASHFSEPAQVHDMLDTLAQERRAWRGELGIVMEDGAALHVGVRAEVVPARDGSVLGFFLIFDDLTQSLRAAAARRQLEQSLSEAKRSGLALDAQGGVTGATDEVMAAVLANASIAAMDITDGGAGPSVAAMLEEIDQSAQRAAVLYGQLRVFKSP
ncbi:MAG: GAF domain-containing protein [Rhodoferax sp.]|nr:GAF domain-containing protein [Rhodoferax sp.]